MTPDPTPDTTTPAVDIAAAESAVRALLVALGHDPDAPGLADTPRRFAAALREMTTPEPFNPTSFVEMRGVDAPVPMPPPVMVHGIPFASLCEHHLMPFTGTVSVAYVPSLHMATGGDVAAFYAVLGLSKLARIAASCAAHLTSQERIGDAIVAAIVKAVDAAHVVVVVDARHSCMEARGARAHGASTRTIHTGGIPNVWHRGDPSDPDHPVQRERAALTSTLITTIAT